MKVLFLTNIPSPYRVDFFNRLGDKCELCVLYERKNGSNRNINWRSEEKRKYKEVFLKGVNIGEEDAFCLSVISYLKKKSYDLVVISGYSTPTVMLAIIYCKIFKLPYILSIDGGRNKKEKKIAFLVKYFFIKGAKAYLCPGEESKKCLVEHGAEQEKIYIYPFTSLSCKDIDEAVVDKAEKIKLKEQLGISEKFILIAIGQFIRRKGFDTLLKAIDTKESDLGVYIIGDSEPTNEYVDIIRKKNLKNIHFVEFQKKDVLNKYYHAADIFVLPTREDIWGLVINEAMAKGLPVITTYECVAGCELIEPGINGWLIHCEDVDMLSKKIKNLVHNQELRVYMSHNNLVKIQKYTLERMADIHFQIFKNLLLEEGDLT